MMERARYVWAGAGCPQRDLDGYRHSRQGGRIIGSEHTKSSVVSSVTASRDLGEMAAGGVLVAAFPFLGSRFCVPVSEGTTRFGIYYPAPHEAKVSQALEEQGKNSRNCR